MAKQKIICVTGPMAAGKNAVCKILEKNNFISLDADIVIRKTLKLCTPEILKAFQKIADEKNISLLDANGNLNSRNLGKIVFTSKELLSKQENIVYPKFIQSVKTFIKENPTKSIIINATVLYKTEELMALCNKIIFVTAPFITRFCRVLLRDKMPINQIIKRFKMQSLLYKKYKETKIPIIKIKNSGSLLSLEKKLNEIIFSL